MKFILVLIALFSSASAFARVPLRCTVTLVQPIAFKPNEAPYYLVPVDQRIASFSVKRDQEKTARYAVVQIDQEPGPVDPNALLQYGIKEVATDAEATFSVIFSKKDTDGKPEPKELYGVTFGEVKNPGWQIASYDFGASADVPLPNSDLRGIAVLACVSD